MTEQDIKNEILKISEKALILISQISLVWDKNILEYVRSTLKEAA